MFARPIRSFNQYWRCCLILALACSVSACHAPDVPQYASKQSATAEVSHREVAISAPTVASTSLKEFLRQKSETSSPADGCNMDSLNDGSFDVAGALPKSRPLKVGGWLIDPALKVVPGDAVVAFESADKSRTWHAPLNHWSQRIDVAQAFGGVRALALSGFSEVLDVKMLPDGNYHVYIVYRSSGALRICDNGRKIAIAG